MSLHFDVLKEEYLDSITSLDKLCFTLCWSRALFESELSSSIAHYILAFRGDTLVGYCGIQAVAGEGSITNVAVHPDYRKQGIASALLEKIIGLSQDKQLDFITLEVRESNINAINLYTKFGFELAGKRKNYYSDNHEAALLMTRQL